MTSTTPFPAAAPAPPTTRAATTSQSGAIELERLALQFLVRGSLRWGQLRERSLQNLAATSVPRPFLTVGRASVS